MNFENLRTVRQVAQMNPAFSESSLRWLVVQRKENGFERVMVRVGGRILIDIEKFNLWLEKGKGGNA